jgi:hypothetical protein
MDLLVYLFASGDKRRVQDAINEQSSTGSDSCSKHPRVLRDRRFSRGRLPGNRLLARPRFLPVSTLCPHNHSPG